MLINKIVLAILATIIPITVLSTIDNFITPVSACQENANGCIKNGGPGESFKSPAEVSGCHDLPPVDACAKDSAPGQNK